MRVVQRHTYSIDCAEIAHRVKTRNLLRDVKSDLLTMIQQEVFSFDNPEKWSYIVVLEKGDQRTQDWLTIDGIIAEDEWETLQESIDFITNYLFTEEDLTLEIHRIKCHC